MRILVALCLGALAALAAPAGAADRVTIAALLANPGPYADREVVVNGVAGESRWANLTVMGNPPFQGLFQMFLLSDGQAALWVVVVSAGQGSIAAGGAAPPPGSKVEIGGVFRATSRAIEMDRPILYR